jgi:hypothetical protein
VASASVPVAFVEVSILERKHWNDYSGN